MTATALHPAEVFGDSATALAGPHLIGSAQELLREQERAATAWQRLRVLAAVEEFLRAHNASREASERVLLTDAGGWADSEAERLHGVAEDAWREVACGWHVMEGSWAARLFVVDEARDAGAEYTRPKVVHTPVAMNWDALDWSKGR